MSHSLFQYNLDFRLASDRSQGGYRDGEEGGSGGQGGDGGKMGAGPGTDGSMWQYGMARRGKGDARRTRVSFLLFWRVIRSHYCVTVTTIYVLLWQPQLIRVYYERRVQALRFKCTVMICIISQKVVGITALPCSWYCRHCLLLTLNTYTTHFLTRLSGPRKNLFDNRSQRVTSCLSDFTGSCHVLVKHVGLTKVL